MDGSKKINKYVILLLGCMLVWGTYFAVRTYQYLPMETASGEVTQITWGRFTMDVPHRAFGDGKYNGDYLCPEVQFSYKSEATDTATLFRVRPQALSGREYKPGDKTGVIFPKGHPEQASLYSFGEFWLPMPWLVILLVITFLWSAGFFVVVFKPWRQM